MHMFSLDPTLGFIQFLEHPKFLEYRIGVNMKGVGMQTTEGQFLMSSKVLRMYEGLCLNNVIF